MSPEIRGKKKKKNFENLNVEVNNARKVSVLKKKKKNPCTYQFCPSGGQFHGELCSAS
jgi:hypothetical protein